VQPAAPVSETVCPGQAVDGIAQVMTGGLVGCWYTDTFVPGPMHQNGDNTYTQSFTGTERFTGCIASGRHGGCDRHDPSGTWYTTYVFVATFTEAGAEISGQCWHPIVWGTGNFAHATGLVHFVDDVPNGISHYTAQISLRGA
jgi:hypothetical protein